MAISLEGKDTELRKRLVIENETISAHCDRIRALKPEFSHTIRCIDRPSDGTCVTYALCLFDGGGRSLCEKLQSRSVIPGKNFVHWLLHGHKLAEVKSAKGGLLAFYFDGGTWKHVGIINSPDRIASKWGTYAVFDSRLSEVPQTYGSDVRFFNRPSPQIAAQLLVEFGGETLDLSSQEVGRLLESAG